MTYSPNFLPGIDASVTLGETSYSYRKWVAKLFSKLGETPNMLAEGAMTRVPGMYQAQITLSTLYDEGNQGVTTVNDLYDLLLGYTDEVELTISALCESITPSIDVTEPQSLEAVLQSTGTFAPAVE